MASIEYNPTTPELLEPRSSDLVGMYSLAELSLRREEATIRLAGLIALRSSVEDRIAENVRDLHAMGLSWANIAPLVGLSPAGAHRRFTQGAATIDAPIEHDEARD